MTRLAACAAVLAVLCASASAAGTSVARALLAEPLFPYCNCDRTGSTNPNDISPDGGVAFPMDIASDQLGFALSLTGVNLPDSILCSKADVHKIEFDAVENAENCVIGGRIEGGDVPHAVSRNNVIDATRVGHYVIKFVITPPISQVEAAGGDVKFIMIVNSSKPECMEMSDIFTLTEVPPNPISRNGFTFKAALFDQAVENKCCVIRNLPVVGNQIAPSPPPPPPPPSPVSPSPPIGPVFPYCNCDRSPWDSLWRVKLQSMPVPNTMGGHTVTLLLYVDPDFATCSAIQSIDGTEYPVEEMPMDKLEIDQYDYTDLEGNKPNVDRQATICTASLGCRITTSLTFSRTVPSFKWTKLGVTWEDGLSNAATPATLVFNTINMSLTELCYNELFPEEQKCRYAAFDQSGNSGHCPVGSFGPTPNSPNEGAIPNSARCIAK